MKKFLFILLLLALCAGIATAATKATVAPVAVGVEKIVDGDYICYVTTKTEKGTASPFKYGSISCIEK